MELFLLRRDEYLQHYNCDAKTDEEWWDEGVANLTFGFYSISIGIFYISLYIPCLIVMKQADLFRLSCFKLMFALGIVDCCSVLINCFYSGIMSVIGAVACPYINFNYVVGALSIAIYAFQCSMCVFLALNRLFDLWKWEASRALFCRNRSYYWIALSALYMLTVLWFGRGCEFSSKANSFFFDPYFGIEMENVDRNFYEGYVMYANNVAAITLLTTIYTLLLISLRLKIRQVHSVRLTRLQIQILLTALMICFLTFISAGMYIYMQLFYTPPWLIVAAQITWQSSTGGAVFTYLALNHTIRQRVIFLICGTRQIFSSTISPAIDATTNE